MKCFKILLYIKSFGIVLAIKSVNHQNAGCLITIPNDIPPNEPVYLKKQQYGSNIDYGLFNPSGRYNYLETDDELLAACPGYKNKLTNHDTSTNNILKLTCHRSGEFIDKSNILHIGQKPVEIKSLNCTKGISASVIVTSTKCSERNKGNIIEVGFSINEITFVPVFQICYNNSTASPIWSQHTVNGLGIKHAIHESKRREFRTDGIPESVNIIGSFKKSNQINNFKTVLGDNQNYINRTSFLSRGHLTPDADFIFTSQQFATYLYANVCPQFQSINAGNWLRIEILVRHLAQNYGTEMIVYTGTYSVLQLPNTKGQQKTLYLDRTSQSNNFIEVPKWLWKTVINPVNHASIVFLTLNNPFVQRLQAVTPFCQNVCDQAGLRSNHFTNIRKGYTICCALNDFVKTVKTLPSYLVTNGNNLLSCATINLSNL